MKAESTIRKTIQRLHHVSKTSADGNVCLHAYDAANALEWVLDLSKNPASWCERRAKKQEEQK
jgi:hypothetical protein